MVSIKLNRLLLYAWILLSISIAFFFINRQIKYKRILDSKGRFTVGVTKGWIHNHRSSKFSVYYEFTHKSIKYRNVEMISSLRQIDEKEGEYLVKYDIDNPKNSKLYFNMKVCRVYVDNFMDTGWVDYKKYATLCE